MRPLGAVRRRLAGAHALLLRPSPGNLASCARSLEAARDLLAAAAADPAAGRAEAAALGAELKTLSALARHAAAFYSEWLRIAASGSREYGPRGLTASAAQARLLARG